MDDSGQAEREAANEAARTLLERISQPEALQRWLAQAEAALERHPEDTRLLLRRAGLLRGLGRLEEANTAYAESARRVADADAIAAILAGTAQGPAIEAGPTRFVRLEGALAENEIASIWQAAKEPGAMFGPARVGIDKGILAPSVRQAALMSGAAGIRGWFLPRMERIVKERNILARLGIAPFELGPRELQITRHVDGGFYRIHKDGSDESGAVSGRSLTYVYYFHRQPRVFAGGDLLLFDHNAQGWRDPALEFTRIAPQHNSLVFFASNRLHAVTRVECASPDPCDGRWTVNGWLHRMSENGSQPNTEETCLPN